MTYIGKKLRNSHVSLGLLVMVSTNYCMGETIKANRIVAKTICAKHKLSLPNSCVTTNNICHPDYLKLGDKNRVVGAWRVTFNGTTNPADYITFQAGGTVNLVGSGAVVPLLGFNSRGNFEGEYCLVSDTALEQVIQVRLSTNLYTNGFTTGNWDAVFQFTLRKNAVDALHDVITGNLIFRIVRYIFQNNDPAQPVIGEEIAFEILDPTLIVAEAIRLPNLPFYQEVATIFTCK